MKTISVRAPGRVELLGNHTDYNGGLVLGAAIDLGLTIQGRRRDDAIVRLISRAFSGEVEVPLRQIERQESNSWANYPLAVTQQFLAAGYRIGGFEAEISGDLPAGSGLSSSAALEVATALFLAKLFQLEIAPLPLARLCQRGENEFVGVRSGLLDQVSCIFGRAGHAVLLDCRNETIRRLRFPADLDLVLADSGVKHTLIASEYNLRRAECAAAAEALAVSSLREITLAELTNARRRLDPVLYRRALHIVGENDRVLRGVAALEREDAGAFGELLNESHESSRVNFENSTPELDRLAASVWSLPGVFGARLTGGGFGGAVIALVAAVRAVDVAQELAEGYRRETGLQPQTFVCRISDGAMPASLR